MQITVHLFGALRDILPRDQRGKTILEVAPDAVVQDILDALELDQPVTIAINEEHDGDITSPLHNGDKVMIFGVSAGG